MPRSRLMIFNGVHFGRVWPDSTRSVSAGTWETLHGMAARRQKRRKKGSQETGSCHHLFQILDRMGQHHLAFLLVWSASKMAADIPFKQFLKLPSGVFRQHGARFTFMSPRIPPGSIQIVPTAPGLTPHLRGHFLEPPPKTVEARHLNSLRINGALFNHLRHVLILFLLGHQRILQRVFGGLGTCIIT